MSVQYDLSSDASLDSVSLRHKISAARKTLGQLKAFEKTFAGESSGDADFDVELTIAINVAHAALLRFHALLDERVVKTPRYNVSPICQYQIAY